MSPSPSLFANAHLNNALWHFAFNRLAAVNDQLVAGRAEVYFGWQFATNASYFSANGMVSAAVASHYGGPGYLALQLEYAPYGKPTGLCSGMAATAYQDEALSLQPCSTPDTTVWILDFKDSQIMGDYSIINASTTNFAHPFVMTILGNPAHQLITPIIMQHLIGNPGNVPANQLWATAADTL